MKKITIFLILTLFTFSSLRSQITREHSVFGSLGVSKDDTYFPIFTDPYGADNFKRSPFLSTQIGYLFDKHFNDKIAFRTGIYLNNQRCFMKSYFSTNHLDIYANEMVSNTYLSTPLYVLFKKNNFYFSTGISVNWAIYYLQLIRVHFPGKGSSYELIEYSDWYSRYYSVEFRKKIKRFGLGITEMDFSADAGIGYYFNIKSQKFSVFANYQFYFCYINFLGKFSSNYSWDKFFNFGRQRSQYPIAYFPMNTSFGLAWHFKTK